MNAFAVFTMVTHTFHEVRVVEGALRPEIRRFPYRRNFPIEKKKKKITCFPIDGC